jgi:DNA-binding transcriptional LysR family regulator
MSSDLEIRHCRVLVALRDHGSVSAAALALGLAQSTVSETLLSLERLVGAPVMLRRRGKEAALTSVAESLLPHARALISAAAAALAAVSVENRGVIRLGAVESISSFLLPPALSAFRSYWPFVQVQVTVGLCGDLRRGVRRGELDAALTLEESDSTHAPEEGWSRVLSPTQLRLIVASPPTPGAESIDRADLVRRTFVLPDPDGPLPALLRTWFGAAPSQWPRIESAGSIDGVKSGVHCSDVVGVLPSYTVTEELATGSLFELIVREPLPAVALGLTIQRQPLEASPLRDMIQQIENIFERSNLIERKTLGADRH